MSVSVKEVAAKAGVSVGTVSNVINRPDLVKPETVLKVRAVIDELGYVPNGAARQLRVGRSQTIALVVLDISNPFFTDVARGVEQRAAQSGHTVLLANSGGDIDHEARHLAVFEQQRVGGLLVSPVGADLARLSELRERGIPVVLVDRVSEGLKFASVSVDDVAGGALAAQHLTAMGRKSVAFVGGPLSIRQVADRLHGASIATAEAGASLTVIATSEMTLEEGVRVGVGLKDRIQRQEFDAVVAANDLLAIGIQRSLVFGDDPVSIPEQLALIGYDDIAYAASAVVPISSIRQPRELMGECAVELLLSGADPSQSLVFKPELVVRRSTVA